MLATVIVAPIPSKNQARIKPSITPNGKNKCKTVILGKPSPNKKTKMNPIIIKLRLLAIQRGIEVRRFSDNMIVSPSIGAPNAPVSVLEKRSDESRVQPDVLCIVQSTSSVLQEWYHEIWLVAVIIDSFKVSCEVIFLTYPV
jgi:hypothetical protein